MPDRPYSTRAQRALELADASAARLGRPRSSLALSIS